MKQIDCKCVRSRRRGALALAISASVSLVTPSLADEGGVSMWLPGTFGSLAAVPQTPGLSAALVYYHTSVKAGGDVAFARQVTLGRLTTNFTGSIDANLKADADLGFLSSSYVFASPFLGGQAAFSVLVPVGRNTTSVDATLIGAIGPLGFIRGASRTDEITGAGDPYLQFAVRWNQGVPQLDDLRHGQRAGGCI